MNTLKLKRPAAEAKAVKRVRKSRRVAHESKVTFLTAIVTVIKYLDNVFCHYPAAIGLWLMCEKFGVLTAIQFYFKGFGGAE